MKFFIPVLSAVAFLTGGAAALDNGVLLGETFGGPHGHKYSDLGIISPGQIVRNITIRAAPLENPAKQDEQAQIQTSLSRVPALRLRVTLTGRNMNIHGQSTFEVYANPVVSEDNSLRYDGFADFVQDNSRFSYMLVDGVSYMVETSISDSASTTAQKVHCLPSILPFENMLPALNSISPIPSAFIGGKAVECPNDSLFQTSFGGVQFVLCSSGSSGFTAYGLDVTMSAEYLQNPIRNRSVAMLKDVRSCPVVVKSAPVTSAGLALLTGEALPPVSRNLKEAISISIQEDRCECKSTPRPCIFLHGLGNPNERPDLQDSPKLTKEKFGDIGDHAPCCTTVKYAVLNTNDAGWTDDTLMQKFCNFSLSMSATSDAASGTISDTIIVTHSMGGVVMANALATGKCKFADTTSWVSLSAPMKGSMAGDYIQELCDDEASTIAAPLLQWVGQCSVFAARKSISYEGGKYSNPALDAAYKTAQEAYRLNVDAAMCSDFYDGVLSKFYLSCIVGGTVIPHKSSKNDGLVEFQSCLGGLDPNMFGDSYEYKFYRPVLNHADTAFLTHDSLFRDSQKPFKWFECLL
ncbi:hypothetical protein F444_16620 [Phytophthora nicotianae P1976]|uniref:GPI inositol-deacylase n=1 Tax=Phytophthora nicotianae P1976 TaxID=1317066 RepID=A0A080ZHM5_PHYNI|nr:hypothetical protein F444_16620 [Phytophthora nicotianae P1976]